MVWDIEDSGCRVGRCRVFGRRLLLGWVYLGVSEDSFSRLGLSVVMSTLSEVSSSRLLALTLHPGPRWS